MSEEKFKPYHNRNQKLAHGSRPKMESRMIESRSLLGNLVLPIMSCAREAMS
jgi:hypothetical protein